VSDQLHAQTALSLVRNTESVTMLLHMWYKKTGIHKLHDAQLVHIWPSSLMYLAPLLSRTHARARTHTHMQSPMYSATKLQQKMKTVYSSSSACKMLFLDCRVEMSTIPSTWNNFLECSARICKKGSIAYYHFPYRICFPLITVLFSTLFKNIFRTHLSPVVIFTLPYR
jgi:hypothetical protein